MNSIRICLALLAAGFMGATALRATDWTTTDGKVYQDVKLIHLDADSVTILDTDGGARIPLDKLPANLQKRFGYDPDVAKAAAEARAKEDVENAKALQAEMNQASEMHQPGAEPTETASTSTDATTTTDAATTSLSISPTPVYSTGTHHFMDEITTSATSLAADPNDASHHSVDEATQAAASMRRDLSDPTYHTMAHMFYTVKSLGPDPTDTTHHTMDEAVQAADAQK
jgi:hypothetical protein